MAIKPNIVLTNPFPINSEYLSGFTDFLADYFNVYFIDLPGFSNTKPPLDEISIGEYVKYLEREIKLLNLDKYLLCGISFGHCLLSRLKPTDKCRAMISIQPYVNKKSLRIPTKNIDLYLSLIKIVKKYHLDRQLWNKSLAEYYSKVFDPKIVKNVFEQIHPDTFSATLELILGLSSEKWQKIPHLLLINPKDSRINFDSTIELFSKNVGELKIITTEIDHFPKDISKTFFKKSFGNGISTKIFRWVEKYY